MLTSEDWHNRFSQQAQWTQELRRYLYRQCEINKAKRILEVGCGTGVITSGLHAETPASVFGIDLSLDRLLLAGNIDPDSQFSMADGLALPFPDGLFDIIICHFFFLWVQQPELAALEMARVTRPGGVVMALAEPDYGGRIDYPEELLRLGSLQEQALQQQGADTRTGRKVASFLVKAGLVNVQRGLLGGQWNHPPSIEVQESEWAVLEEDLRGVIPESEIIRLRAIDRQAWNQRERILFVPTIYAWGRVLQ
jgi:SAM-dependent methyltransferase